MVEGTADIDKSIELFKATFDMNDVKEREKALIIIDYIIRQLNQESLKGHLDYYQYCSLVMHAVKGLFKLIYIDFYNFDNDGNRLERLIRADVIYNSSYNFMMMLFTRVFEGRDRELIIRQIESQRPVYVGQR
ncbi:MAG: hypothetical protein ACPL6C_00615 [bacterium]